MKPLTRMVFLGCVLAVAGALSNVVPASAQEAPAVRPGMWWTGIP